MKNIKEFSWLIGGIGLELYARVLGFYDANVSNKNPVAWEIASSTKNLNIGEREAYV